MGRKQSRQNRGARTGGHDRSTAAEAKEQQPRASAPRDTEHRISEPATRKHQRKFGHN
ncbi:hypothetical protein FBY35_0500 [Streptomyces sp. SLBN-118]|uniref:hypothetical protein n=1 Tax=Streptomyces sp. SLBN-118 TaxID=2768454 RepID=UPI001170356E|nr:hypothetical protein [Streptomyces sp. SLBN-118]TQK50182.1 hypothetical protein FBY35_0500 [Streptomyces sp. SLBN-118]